MQGVRPSKMDMSFIVIPWHQASTTWSPSRPSCLCLRFHVHFGVAELQRRSGSSAKCAEIALWNQMMQLHVLVASCSCKKLQSSLQLHPWIRMAKMQQLTGEIGGQKYDRHPIFSTTPPILWARNQYFPTCQVRVVRFYVSCLLLLSSPLLSSSLLVSSPRLLSSPPLLSSSSCSLPDLNHDHPCPVFPAGPQPRPSPPSVPCRTSTTTIPAQCSLPDLNHDHPRPVFPAGPQPRPSPPSVPCRTSTWDLPSSVFPAGPQPRVSTPSVPCRTSTWDLPSSVCTAGPQRPDRMPEDMPDRTPDRMPEDMPDKMPWDMQIECQKVCQIECQKVCQIECQIECQKICQIECQKMCQ